MAPGYSTAWSISHTQKALENYRRIRARLAVVPKLARMSEADQIKLAELIHQDKLHLHENGMLDATPRTPDIMAM